MGCSHGLEFSEEISLEVLLMRRQNDKRHGHVPVCGASRAIAGIAGHPCPMNATPSRLRVQSPPRLSRRRPALRRARTPRSAPGPRLFPMHGQATASRWRSAPTTPLRVGSPTGASDPRERSCCRPRSRTPRSSRAPRRRHRRLRAWRAASPRPCECAGPLP